MPLLSDKDSEFLLSKLLMQKPPRVLLRSREVVSRLPKGKIVGAEVGVFAGHMSAELLRMAPELTLYMVDSWHLLKKKNPKGLALLATDFAVDRRIILHKQSVEAAKDIEDGSLDFVFIDADHDYLEVRDDIAAWAPKVKPGGLLCGHDYGKPKPSICSGVDKAVHEFLEGTDMTLVIGRDYTWFVHVN